MLVGMCGCEIEKLNPKHNLANSPDFLRVPDLMFVSRVTLSQTLSQLFVVRGKDQTSVQQGRARDCIY